MQFRAGFHTTSSSPQSGQVTSVSGNRGSTRTAGGFLSTSMRYFTIFMAAAALVSTMHAAATINPGEIWPDDRGKHIQAHGGGILKLGDLYYWFGEDRAQGLDPAKR